jgi:hypothetical protein
MKGNPQCAPNFGTTLRIAFYRDRKRKGSGIARIKNFSARAKVVALTEMVVATMAPAETVEAPAAEAVVLWWFEWPSNAMNWMNTIFK